MMPKIGVFFTPLTWCSWALEKSGAYEALRDGKSIFDPTAGKGNFLESLIEFAVNDGLNLQKVLPLIFACEINPKDKQNFLSRIKQRFGLVFPESNFITADILLDKVDVRADVIIGNPPWANYNDIPEEYKQRIKPLFRKYGLVNKHRTVLLGNSRVDIAALVVIKTLSDNLSHRGEAHYFLPLSLFLNEGAHRPFRTYQALNTPFKITSIYDFKLTNIFSKSGLTRYGFVNFINGAKQSFPISYFAESNSGRWEEYLAAPSRKLSDPLSIYREGSLKNIPVITLKSKGQMPRQGVNTCGRNDLFVFDSLEPMSGGLVKVGNKSNSALLPETFIFPLLHKDNLKGSNTVKRWILIPHDKVTGKPLDWGTISLFFELKSYLLKNKEGLKVRKGVLIQSHISKGAWWALLGVGIYSFAPYKVIWQALGTKELNAMIFEGVWQGNQSMHAFIPCHSKPEALTVKKMLNKNSVQEHLLTFSMEGTRNWAQPGRIKQLINYSDDRQQQLLGQEAFF